MATRGTEDDIFECSVCLNDMVDRNPRGLPCLHSFCEECLKQLVRNKTITCPTCRKLTGLKENDVNELPINFMLKKMRDRDLSKAQKPTKPEDIPQTVSQICRVNVPEYKCKDCPRLMCLSCKNAHSDIEEYKDHSVLDLCHLHHDHITHLCKKCTIPLCMICMVVQHNHHKEHFQKFSKAMESIQKDITLLQDTITMEASQIDFYMEQIQYRSKDNADTKLNLQQQKQYHADQIEEINNLLKTTDINVKIFDKIHEKCRENKDRCDVVTASLTAVKKDKAGVCSRYEKLQEKAKDCVTNVRKLLSEKYDTPRIVLNEFVPTELVKCTEQGDIMISKDIKLSKLVLDIPTSDEINCTEQIDFMGSDVVLPTSNKPHHVIQLDSSGRIVDRYYPSIKNRDVCGVCVHKENIYIAQSEAITVISSESKETIAVYKPNIDNMDKILVTDEQTIFISDFGNPGCIYKYTVNNDKTEVMVQGLEYPSYITKMNSKDGLRYIVSDTYGHCIRVYDQHWRMLYKFGSRGLGEGQFDCTRATTVTPLGTLLIADQHNNRILHYSLEGEFIDHIITQQHGINDPAGIAFKHPYLWVCSYSSDYVKCYQMK